MLFTLGLLVGLALGAGLVAFSRTAKPASGSSADDGVWPWTAMALGTAAVGAFALGIAGVIDTALAILPVIALEFAAIVFGLGRLVLGDRRWQSWLGAGLAFIPALFWVVFVIAEIVGPPH